MLERWSDAVGAKVLPVSELSDRQQALLDHLSPAE